MEPELKSLLFIHTGAPHGSINAQEALDALLMGSAFADCSALFLGAGLMQLLTHQDTSKLGLKNFSRTFGALKDYGVSKIYCRQKELLAENLTCADLVIECLPLTDEEISTLLASDHEILNF